MGEERVKRLADIKSYLERRIEELENEISILRDILAIVDEALSESSFRPASSLAVERIEAVKRTPSVAEKPLAEHDVIARTGELLAKIYVYENELVVKPLVTLHVDTPPFRVFLINRILEGYKKKDERRVYEGEISKDQVLDYEVVEEEGVLKELRIRNYGDRRRLHELRGVIRWTLNRMFEKESQYS